MSWFIIIFLYLNTTLVRSDSPAFKSEFVRESWEATLGWDACMRDRPSMEALLAVACKDAPADEEWLAAKTSALFR